MSSNFADVDRPSLAAADISVGDAVKPMDLALCHTTIAAAAFASMDYMPVHHDKDFALSQFAPDIFLNIHSSNGFVSRFLTDWAGPEAWVKCIDVKLGVPAVPHQTLKFRGEVLAKTERDDEVEIEVSVVASNDMGNHVTGSATITLPK